MLDFVELAATLCDTPMAALRLGQSDWTVVSQSPISEPQAEYQAIQHLCSLLSDSPNAVRDAAGDVVTIDLRQDPRTEAHPLVRGQPQLWFYARVSLLGLDGELLGELCVLDGVAHALSDRQQRGLQQLGRQIVNALMSVAQPSAAQLSASTPPALSPLAKQTLSQDYLHLTNSLHGILWEAELEGDRLQLSFVSAIAATVLGYPVEQWLSEPDFWPNHIYPADRDWVINRCWQIMQDGQEEELEYRMVAADGRLVWLRDTLTLVPTVVGDFPTRPVRLWGIKTDITEARLVRQERDRFFTQSIDLLSITGLDGYFKCLNPAWSTTLGYTQAELQAEPFLHFVHPDDRNNTLAAFETLRAGDNVIAFENRYRCKDGSYRWFMWNSRVQRDDQRIYSVAHDITKRKQAEQAIQQSNHRIINILESITDAFFALDRQWRFTYVNAEAERLLQRQAQDLISHCVWDQFPESVGTVFQREYRRAIADQVSVTFEAYYQPLDTWFAVHAYPSKDGLAVYFRNVTERKRMDYALRQQAERERLMGLIAQRVRQSLDIAEVLQTTVAEVRQFLEADRVIIFRFQSDWSGVVTIESVANSSLSILHQTIADNCFASGYVQQYQQGRVRSITDIQQEPMNACYRQMLEGLGVRANLVVPILQGAHLWGLLVAHHCSGPRQWQTQDVRLLQQLATQVAIAIQQSQLYQQVQLINTDLEQQVQERTVQLERALEFEALLKRITDKLRDSLEESQILQTAVDELANGLDVITCDTGLYDLERGTSTVCYESAKTEVKVVGLVWRMADYPEFYSQLLANQKFQFCHAHSLRGWVTILVCPIVDDQGVLGDLWLSRPKEEAFSPAELRLVQQVASQCAIALRQARLYQAAQTQVQELEKLNQLKDDFLSTVSHELRTPVSNIKMAIQMLAIALSQYETCFAQHDEIASRTASKTHLKASHYLQILQRECDREINLINDLLDLQRLDANSHAMHLELIDVPTWLMHMAQPYYEQAEQRQQHLSLRMPTTLPQCWSDQTALTRILTELLHNACKYTPPNCAIELAVQAHGADYLQLQVTNWGSDIPAEEQPRIFDKFYRVLGADPWKQGGTGLGLALVQRLTQILGGTLQVESHNSKTCFTLTLPLQIAPGD